MSVRTTAWWLLATLTISECWAAIPSKRQTFPNIENGWPLSDKDVEEGGDFVIQMPSCLALQGVCTLRQNCQEEYIHEASDLCGDQADTVCCLTRSAFEKHVLQLKSCADTGSVCAFEEDCPEQDRHSNPLLCGDQLGVTCCRTLPQIIPKPRIRQAQNNQLLSCEAHGGICRQEKQCPKADRLGNADMCGNQPYITCCQATDIDSPIRPFYEKELDQKNKRRAHSGQIKSCEAQGGLCRQTDQCGTEDRMGNSDLCGDQPSITCCKVTNVNRPSPQQNEKRRAHSVQIESCIAQGGICKQNDQCPEESRLETFNSCGDDACCTLPAELKEISSAKRSPKLFPSFLQKKSVNIGPRRPNDLPTTLCESEGGTCMNESHCPEQDRLGSSDMCANEPNVICCIFSSRDPGPSEDKNKRNAHSVQNESCRAQSGMCTYVANCPAEDQLGEAMCGSLASITCCHLRFLESAMSQDQQSVDVVPEEKTSRNRRGGAIPIQIKSCKAQGGVCKKKIECLAEDYIDASDICGKPYELIYTCCRASNDSVTKRRANSVHLESCRAQGGMCRQTDLCPEIDRLGSDSCGDLPYITCCKRSDDTPSSGAEPRMIGKLSLTRECLMRGGLCRRNEDCFPEDRYENTKLCGSQAGVSCCKRLPPRVGECSERGGECVPESVCQNGPKDKFGQCSGSDVCCIWVK